MRGHRSEQVEIISTLTPDELVPNDHPIRRIKVIVDRALAELDADFAGMYSRIGRPSIAPERLLKASLLIALYTVRSERQFCERLQYDMLFKWFLHMNIGDPAFDPPRSARTGIDSSTTRSPIVSSTRCGLRQSVASCSPTITSRWTARSWRPGLR
jgi:Transposase domain (DUF772)